MGGKRLAVLLSLVPVAACAAEGAEQQPTGDLRVEVGSTDDLQLFGVADAPRPDTDELPLFEIFAASTTGSSSRSLGIVAVDAAVDRTTRSLAWIDPIGTLWVAPLESAPDRKRSVAEQVIPGLAASHGRLAYAVRVDGPDTAPFVLDLRNAERIALADAAGPDEILGFSPAGDEVLVLSGRTGLASLFALGVNEPSARQLTNVGLVPGPLLDTSRVAPAPANRRDVAWSRGGIEYRAAARMIRVEEPAQ